jgi:hypothetical protein
VISTIERNRQKIFAEEELRHLDCYIFNISLSKDFDDGLCEHCGHYFTTNCPYIDDFLEDEDFE